MSTINEVTANTAGISEKVTTTDFSDPQFAVFGGAAVSGQTKNVSTIIETVAGISKGNGYSGPYDANFSVF